MQGDHLDRQALIYVRPAIMRQVLKNTGSKIRQYDLAQGAFELGWPSERIVVIDEDQGTSGTSFTERDGFEQVVAEVGLGRTGAVFCLEASRLARSNSNWYLLI